MSHIEAREEEETDRRGDGKGALIDKCEAWTVTELSGSPLTTHFETDARVEPVF